jgi:histidyl-tRNA synthetase
MQDDSASPAPRKNKLATEPYKGVRDFYPEDQRVQNYLFDTMRLACERFGYEEYHASVLEPAELYRGKNAENEEIVNEQTYSFTDRGGREVTLRPEMTPTVARLIAAKRREIPFPARWFSIPNVFRYERPQRGRVREHWQLNADLFGVSGVEAEAELIALAAALLQSFGATPADYEVRINSRALVTLVHDEFGLSRDDSRALLRLIDRKNKMDPAEFELELAKIAKENAAGVGALLTATTLETFLASATALTRESDAARDLERLFELLHGLGIENARFDPTLARGFDYYTGIVFEVFDTSPENNRSMFGGGRYDRLLELFGDEKIPAVGFGMGDVTLRDFLESRSLLPAAASAAQLLIATVSAAQIPDAMKLAQRLRGRGARVAVNLTQKKLGDQLKYADRLNIPRVAVLGEDEVRTGQYALKHLASGNETVVSEADLLAAFEQ